MTWVVPRSVLALCRWVSLPEIFERLGERLPHDGAVYMHCVPREYKLVVISLVCENLRGALVCQNPIMHVVAHYVGIEKIFVADFHPNANRLRRTPGD